MMKKTMIHTVIPKLAISLERQKQTEAAPSRQSAIATLRRENLIRLIIFSDSLAIRPLIIKAIAAPSLHEAAFSRASIMPYQSMNMIDGYECHYIEIEFLYYSHNLLSASLLFTVELPSPQLPIFSFRHEKSPTLLISVMLEALTRILLIPVNVVVTLVLLPIVLVGQAISGISSLMGLASLMQSGDLPEALAFLRSDSSDPRRRSILSEKFPNSIAVRS